MNILGISALYHDSAAALVCNGNIVAAAQEERFTRIKHDYSFPVNAINYCLAEGKITKPQVDLVVFYDNPLLTLDRYLNNILCAGSDAETIIEKNYDRMFSDRFWIHKTADELLGVNPNRRFMVCEHHMSHAASAFYPSPFHKAVVITIDGVGEWETTTIGVGEGRALQIKEELRYPHSLGLMYSAFTYFCGFKVNSGDYKFMGLAPYGEPVYEDLIRKEIIDIKEDGSFRLNLKYFDFQYGRAMTNDSFAELFGGPRREPESVITKREMDIAASAQKVTEELIINIARHAKEMYGKDIDNLCLAGGVALNCVANGKLKNTGIFKNIWIQPAAGDAGGALGAALFAAYHMTDKERQACLPDGQKGSYLGPRFSNESIEAFLNKNGYSYHRFDDETLYTAIAKALCSNKVIGLFHGRMEFGPRALGNRSIIGDARSEEMQTKMNLKIKYRESFRPFAPSVLRERVSDYFELEDDSPYMLLVENVREERRLAQDVQQKLQESNGDMLMVVREKRSDLPAITHVDYSARIQTVTEETNPYYYRVIKAFEKLTGCGVIVNTSFNVRGEPIVCTPKNAYECFMRTELDVLVLENCVLYKEEQPAWEEHENWREMYQLD